MKREILEDGLLMLVAAGLKGGPSPQDLGRYGVKAWIAVMERHNVTDHEFKAACTEAMSRFKFFPAPAEMLELVEHERRKTSSLIFGMVEADDDQGGKWLAPPEKVKLGRLLPPGDESGDGSPAPKALSEGRRSLGGLEKRLPIRVMPRSDPIPEYREPTQAERDETERIRKEQLARLEDDGA